MHLRDVQLNDRYMLAGGRLFLSGTQALVRVPVMQHQFDIESGLHTAAFISGYRGSPLGGYDMELSRNRRLLEENEFVVYPAVNEEVAATAVWGSQQATLFSQSRLDGVMGLWYGKGPGVDRAGDAIKHGNLAGASEYGGVLLVFGDDHPGKSSTTAHQSDQSVAAHSIPVLYPATVSDIVDFGLYGIALSRYSGLWVGIKCVNETVENTATVDIVQARDFSIPEDFEMPPGGLNTRMEFDPIGADKLLQRFRLPAARLFARTNRIDCVLTHGMPRRLGVISAGKSYLDLIQALNLLGLDVQGASASGIGLYKLGMIWPLEEQGLADFSTGYDELLVVEEKKDFVESQVRNILYERTQRPHVIGKRDVHGAYLLPSDVQIEPLELAILIAKRLIALGAIDRDMEARFFSLEKQLNQQHRKVAQTVSRLPYFCSGCPHNSSTRVPAGSLALTGIGCNTMAVWMNRNSLPPTQMGGEGSNWIGISPFTDLEHVFQNMGDGTYFHSGYLSIRAAVDSGVNITFKILFNDATAMTGGQPTKATTNIGVEEIVRQVIAEGVRKIALVSDDIRKYKKGYNLPGHIDIRHRDDLDAVQRELRKVPGTTVIVYDQVCAAEKRRRIKRGLEAVSGRRIFINAAVCEGCNDCSTQSNCVSIQPLETDRGRKRKIDQSSCTEDFSCVNGFCPSFVSIYGGKPRRPVGVSMDDELFARLTTPEVPGLETPYSILITGIGGTGVTTVSAILGMSAHMDYKVSSTYDMTGLAQKGGAVTSHIRLANRTESIGATKIGRKEADLILGCDLIVSGSEDVLQTMRRHGTNVVLNTSLTPTGAFQLNGDMDFQEKEFLFSIREQVGEGMVHNGDFSTWAMDLLCDTIASNLMLVGFAYQKGLIPISGKAIECAIRLNGVKIDCNLSAWRLGRLAASNMASFRELLPTVSTSNGESQVMEDSERFIQRQREWLCAYQNEAYAARYSRLVATVDRVDFHPEKHLTSAVAECYAKLLAYKDEYEVARLYTNGEFVAALKREFEEPFKLRFHLAPPFLPGSKGPDNQPKKRVFGPSMMGAFWLLAKFKFLRGTPLDVFAYSTERRAEKALIGDYEKNISELLAGLKAENYDVATEIALLPRKIRGFGHVKMESITIVQKEAETLWASFRGIGLCSEPVRILERV